MNVDRFLDHLWLLVHQRGRDPPTEESSRSSAPCPDCPRACAGFQQWSADNAAHCFVDVAFIVQLKDGYEDPSLRVDGEQPLIVEISRCPLACSLLVGVAHVSEGLVGNRTFTLEEPLAEFTTANRLTLGGSGDDLRVVDVVLVDLLAQCVSPGYLEPFVLLVEADGALHLVATQARLGAVGCRRFDVRGRSGRRTMGRTRLKAVPSNPPPADVPYSGPASTMTSAASASPSENELKIVLAGSPVPVFIMRTTHQANDIFNRRGLRNTAPKTAPRTAAADVITQDRCHPPTAVAIAVRTIGPTKFAALYT